MLWRYKVFIRKEVFAIMKMLVGLFTS